ncbi:cytochrome P450 [Rhizorhabdus wittichii]
MKAMDATLANGAPVLDIDQFTIGNILDPYPLHRIIREHAPVSYVEKYATYVTGRYDEVKAVLSDWETFTSTYGAGLADIRKPDNWRQPGPVVESDPPDHTAIRKVLTNIISPRVIRGWQEDFAAYAATQADRVVEMGEVNGAKDIAEDFVMTVFPASLGLQSHPHNMVIVGDFNFNALGPRNALFEESNRKLAEIMDWYEETQGRDLIQPGSFSDQVYAAEDAGLVKKGDAKGMVRTMLRGGMDTTISGIGSSLLLMAQHPAIWASLRENRGRLKMVFEEAIRLEAPIQSYFRTTTRATELGGIALEAETKVQIFIGAANRDPRKWDDPDRYDINRAMAGHLAFGAGIHVCIGQLIARMEAEAVLGALLDRVERIELTGEPVYRPLNTLRTLDELPLRLVPA